MTASTCLSQLLFVIAAAGVCGAQSFEAATVRTTAPGTIGDGQWSLPGGSIFRATNVTLALLTSMAYGVDAKQIKGAPSFFDSRHFDVDAKAEPGIVLTREALRPRLQHLLEERFHLVAHRETVQVSGFTLVVAPRGPKLSASKDNAHPNFRINVGPGKLQGTNWTMTFCALMLTPKMGAPVEDRTGLSGRYDVDVEYASDLSADSPLPALTTAIQERLGLKLVPRKVFADVIVVDGVNEIPADN